MEYIVDLQPDEHIIKEVRRDLFVFSKRIAFIVILFFLPTIFSAIIIDLLANFLESPVITFVVLYLMFILFLIVIFFLQWTNYFMDVWVITNQHIFDIEQKSLLNREISIFRLENVEDITVETKGLQAMLFKYGDIQVNTAGEKADFIIRDASDPTLVKKIILEAHSEALKKNS